MVKNKKYVFDAIVLSLQDINDTVTHWGGDGQYGQWGVIDKMKEEYKFNDLFNNSFDLAHLLELVDKRVMFSFVFIINNNDNNNNVCFGI